jgi:beta-phosphoglucomutase
MFRNILPFFFTSLFLPLTVLTASLSTPYGEIKAILFDCDGILVNSEYQKFLSWQKAFKEKNIDFSLEEYLPLVGHSSKNILLLLQKQKGIKIPEKVIEQKNIYYRNFQEKEVLPIAEMVFLAKELSYQKKNSQIFLAVASSAPREEIFLNLQKIGLENCFDLVISGTDDLDSYIDREGKNKPKPYIYLEAAKRYHLSPHECMVFEDSSAGIQAAKDAGMIAIAIPNAFTSFQDFSSATKVVRSYQDPFLLDLIKSHP